MNRTTNKTIAAVAIVLAALASACTDKPPPSPPPNASAPASGSPGEGPASPMASIPAQSPEQATQSATDAYVGMQNAFVTAGQRGDPAFADLAKYSTGSALTQLTNGLKSYQIKGLLLRGQAVFRPKVTTLSPPSAPTKASVRDCMDTSGTTLYKANGDPYQDTPGGRRLVLADVERIDGLWKVTSFAVRAVGSCTA